MSGAMSAEARRAVAAAFVEVLRSREPGVRWRVVEAERLERDTAKELRRGKSLGISPAKRDPASGL